MSKATYKKTYWRNGKLRSETISEPSKKIETKITFNSIGNIKTKTKYYKDTKIEILTIYKIRNYVSFIIVYKNNIKISALKPKKSKFDENKKIIIT